MAVLAVIAIVLLALTFILVNPFREPQPLVGLTGLLAIASYYLTLSGAGNVAPLTAIAVILSIVTRPSLGMGRRVKEFLVLFVIIFGTMQAWQFTEPVVKRMVAQPRPVIVELATKPAGAPSLQMPLESFYQLKDYQPNERRTQLAKILTADFTDIEIDPRIREHWVGMTDYGFPSGHSAGAMMNGMFFVAMGLSYLSVRRRWLSYAVLAWGFGIAYSRPILREHSPEQVLVGGTIGIGLALIAFLLSRLIIDKVIARPGEQRIDRIEASAA